MKKVLLIILISFLGRDLIGQPITKRGGASVTVNDENLFVGKSFRVPVFADTTAANAAVTLDSAGKLIFTYDINGLWLRESNPKKWVEVGSGGGGSGSGIVSLGIVGNYGLTRINDSTYRVDTILIATRARLMHVADSLLAIIGAKPSGSGTTDYLARWTNSTTLGTGATRDDGTNVGIGVAPGTYKLNVNGSLNVATSIYLPSSASTTGNIYKNNTKWLHNGGLAGSSLTNIYMGNNAGNDTALFYNVGIGASTLIKNNGFGNVAIGDGVWANIAGYDGGDNSSNNIGIGARAGYNATGGHRNIAIGVESGDRFNDSAYSNVVIGKGTGRGQRGGVGNVYLGASIASGDYAWGGWNSIVGSDILQNATSAQYNAVLGANSLQFGSTASFNAIVGERAYSAGLTNQYSSGLGWGAGYLVTGDYDVLIGAFAAAYETNISNKLVINADASGSPRHLINGDFSTRKVGIDRTLSELAAGSQALQVNGNMYGTGNLRLGGLTNGAGNKAVRFNLSDSSFYLADTTSGGGGGTPGGSNTQVQFNNSGAFGGSANFTWNGTRMSTIAATIGSTSTPDATSPLTVDAASTNTAYLLQMGKNGNPAYFRVDKDGNITDIGGGAAPISSSGGKPNFTNGFASTSWASNSEGNAVLSTLGGSTVPWILNTSASTTDNMVSFRVMGNNATTKGDIQQWTDNSGNILSVVNKDGKFGAGVSSPTAFMHLKAGTATANTAPIKLNTGTALTTPEDGAIEYHGSHIYFTIGSTRYQLDQQTGTNIYNSDGSLPSSTTRQVDGNNSVIDWLNFDTYNINGTSFRASATSSGRTGILQQTMDSLTISYSQNNKLRYNLGKDSLVIKGNMGISASSADSVLVRGSDNVVVLRAQSDLGGGLLSGTYTPTLTNVANVAASTAYSCQYSRVGTVVTVSGEVDIDPTTTLTLTQLGISLPIASNLTATNELGGTSADDLGTVARVAGDATNNRAEIRMTPVDVTNRRFSFTFTYRIL